MASPEIKTESENYYGNGQICRLCMSEESLDDVLNDKHLKEWIWEFLAIKISSDDGMSQVICTICRLRLTEFHQFRTGCHEVQEVLQALILDGTNGARSAQTAPVQMDPNAGNQVQRIVNMDSSPTRCEVLEDEKQLSDHETIQETGNFRCSICETSCTSRERLNNHLLIHTTIGLENPRNTHVKTENVPIEEQNAASTSKTENEVSSCRIRSEYNCGNLESQEDPLCVTSFAKVESPTHFQDDQMENNPLDIEDCIFVGEIKVEARLDDEVTVSTKKRKTVTDICVNENSSVVSLKRGQDEPLSRKTVNYSSHPERSDSESNEADFDAKVSESDYADEVEQHSTSKNCEERYKCSKCDQTFNRDCRLKAHMAIHEEKENDESSHESSREDEKFDKSNKAVTSDEKQEKQTDSKEVHQCDICQKVCSSSIRLTIHKRCHNKIAKKQSALTKEKTQIETSSECDVCHKTYLNKYLMVAHKKRVHGPKTHRCDICDVQYTTRDQMATHVYTNKHIEKVQEMQGLEVEESPNKTSTKQKKNIDKKNIIDSILLKDDLFVKYQPNHPNQKYDGSELPKCDVCDKTFLHRSHLATHKRTHKPSRFICNVCEKPCDNSRALQRHLVTHVAKVKPPKEENATVKRKKAKPPGDMPFKCDTCKTVFKTKNILWFHNKSVHGPKQIECDICGFKFAAKKALMRHLETHESRGHTKEDFRVLKKLSQQNDESTSPKNDALDDVSSENETNDNDNAHEGPAVDKPFQCSLCQKAFEKTVLLYRHNRLEHRPRKFMCSVCGKCYTFRSQLNTHMKIHKLNSTDSTAAKEFECPDCHKIYISWKGLYRHVRDRHVDIKKIGDITFACSKCDKKFKTKNYLDVHTQTLHASEDHNIQLWHNMTKQHDNTIHIPDSEATPDESNSEDSVQYVNETTSK